MKSYAVGQKIFLRKLQSVISPLRFMFFGSWCRFLPAFARLSASSLPLFLGVTRYAEENRQPVCSTSEYNLHGL
ncbi:MAG: hypothetical protein SPI30_08330 [Prevotella sp.]|nr:hypothetical protein [Prevotella sp.]